MMLLLLLNLAKIVVEESVLCTAKIMSSPKETY